MAGMLQCTPCSAGCRRGSVRAATSSWSPSPGSLISRRCASWYSVLSAGAPTTELECRALQPMLKSRVPVLQKAADSEHVDLRSIRLRPEHFPAYLAKEFGFRLLKEYTVPSRVAGFDRPVYWFKKEGLAT